MKNIFQCGDMLSNWECINMYLLQFNDQLRAWEIIPSAMVAGILLMVGGLTLALFGSRRKK